MLSQVETSGIGGKKVNSYLINIVIPLIAALISGLLTLLGVRLTIKKNEEKSNNALEPIIINVPYDSNEDKKIRMIILENNKNNKNNESDVTIKGSFKCINGIFFIDHVESLFANTDYSIKSGYAVETGQEFIIELSGITGDIPKQWKLLFHDILGRRYYYLMDFNAEDGPFEELLIKRGKPIKVRD